MINKKTNNSTKLKNTLSIILILVICFFIMQIIQTETQATSTTNTVTNGISRVGNTAINTATNVATNRTINSTENTTENNNSKDSKALEKSVENSINEVLDKYMKNVNLNSEVEKAINDTVNQFFEEMDKEELVKKVKENIKSALQTHLNEIQEKFEKTIQDKTYEYSTQMLDKKVKEEIGNEMRKAISTYNESCYYKDSKTGYRYLKPGAKLIDSTTADSMVSSVLRYVDVNTTIGTELSTTILNDTTEFKYLADFVTDYLFTDEQKLEAVNKNGGNLQKVDRLGTYITSEGIIQDIKQKMSFDITTELKDVLKEGISSYLSASAGNSIFNDIKTGIYYYIQENGGLDRVVKEGFSDKAIEYITDQITKIVSGNIQCHVTPYISNIASNVLENTIKELSEKYINNGVDKLIRESVINGVTERFNNSLSDLMYKNIVASTDKYLKNLKNNQNLKNLINREFSSYTQTDYGYTVLEGVGIKYRYTYDEDGNISSRTETDTATMEYMKNTIFPTIKKAVEDEMASYINGEKGTEIIELAKSNIKDVLKDYCIKPLILNINKAISKWTSDGIAEDMWETIKSKVYEYLKNIENDPESFQAQTGILLGEILKEVNYDQNPIYDGQISFEDLANTPYLVSAQRGRIIVSKNNKYDALNDATLEIGSISSYEVPTYDSGTKIVYDPSSSATGLINPWAPNPYGFSIYTYFGTFGIPGPAGLSRTLAEYSSRGIKKLEPEEAYVLAHEKDTKYYPDAVQNAYWKVLEDVRGIKYEEDNGIVDSNTYNEIKKVLTIASTITSMGQSLMNMVSQFQSVAYMTAHQTFSNVVWTSMEYIGKVSEAVYGVRDITNALTSFMPKESEIIEGKDPESPTAALELHAEAMSLGTALDNWDKFKEENGESLVDRTDYSKVKVSYSKNTDKVLVGPFTIDYVREFFVPLSPTESEMYDKETNIISYTGIVGAELYADDEKTIPVNDWKFVYPDKRECLSEYDQKYEYPYPNETFYLEFSSTENYSINTLSKMRFLLEKMDADGQTYELSGGYDQLLWMGVDIPLVCPLPPTKCIHGIDGGHPIPPYAYCPPVCCPIHFTPTGTPPFHLAYNGHLFGHNYFCQQVPLGTNLHAMNLEQIIYSKIYKEYKYVELELGEVQEYDVTSINNTQNMKQSVNKGNITEQANEVPTLPFLPNYDTYPGYKNYPNYKGNPNYPNNPYTFNNEEYSDYPSYPQYNKGKKGEADPTYPYYPENKFIPLTFHISGTVWLDNPSGKEANANGIIDENERGIPNVEVTLYKKGDKDYISKTLTNEGGYYIFEYVRVGFDYYVEFAYDGMTYKTTEYLQSDVREHSNENLSQQTDKYKKNPENYVTSSHALENSAERDAFNDKFYHISENLATSKDGKTIPLEYKTWETPNGAVSTVITVDEREITKNEFKMYARTSETDLYFAVDNQYQVSFDNLDLYHDGTDKYTKTYPCLEHINLGLILREQGDIATKTDAYQVITTMKNDIQRYKYNDKTVQDNTYDILYRNGDYYTKVPYNQELNPDDVAYRADKTYEGNENIVSTVLNEKSELNVYIEYKILIKNKGTLESCKLIEIENSFDQNLEYNSKYDFTDLASWIEVPMDGTNEKYRQEILWQYRNGTDNGYSTIYTDNLKEKSLQPGEVVEIHLILKVKKDENRQLKMDLEENQFKENITEVTIYSYNEGLLDKTSNSGSARLGNLRTYSDGTDRAPLLKLIYDKDYSTLNSNTIQGYIWEDLINNSIPQNNQLISNGIIDKNEKKINNVKVELIEVIMDTETGKEKEVLRKTASGTEYYRTGENIRVDGETIEIADGEYKFVKLETGTYRVKFTYGDEYQLIKDLTYNAQDYKTLSLDTSYQQYYKPKMEVVLMLDTSESMQTDNKAELMKKGITRLVDKLYKNIQTVKVGAYLFSEPAKGGESAVALTEKPSVNNVLNLFNNGLVNKGRTLSDTIEDALNKFSRDTAGKVIVIMTDGYTKQSEKDKAALKKAEEQGVKVITVACSTDEWDATTFGTEENPTAGKLYNIRHKNCVQYVGEVALEDILLEFEKVLPNLADAKDVEYSYSYYDQNNLFEDIYSRKHNIDYSSTMTNENAEILHIENIETLKTKLRKELSKPQEEQNTKVMDELKEEIASRIKELAENTKVTAITPNRNITFLQDKERTQNVNLGLVERPKVEFKIGEKISRIQVKLSNGETIIDTESGLVKNLQEMKNKKYIYLDEEIMQGATIEIQYRFTVTNNGNVDTLGDYFTYDMFNEEEVANATTTVANKLGTLYDYYTNTIFRILDNNNMNIEVNDVELSKLRYDGVTIRNWKELVQKGKAVTPEIKKINTRVDNDNRAIVLQEKLIWKDSKDISLNSIAEKQIDNDKIKVIQTQSLRDIPIYPNISKEAISKNGVSSINLYVNYSKQLAANDKDDTLDYKNSTEIVERLNAVGRRDYKAIAGNYAPHNEEITEYDSAIAENVILLPPFGNDRGYVLYILIALVSGVILVAGIQFIRKKV